MKQLDIHAVPVQKHSANPAIFFLIVLVLFLSAFFAGCSESESNNLAGGVTDIPNIIVKDPDSTLKRGKVIDLEGRLIPSARVVAYFQKNFQITDSIETFADESGKYSFTVPKKKNPPSAYYAEFDNLSGITGCEFPLGDKDSIRIGKSFRMMGRLADTTIGGYMWLYGTNFRAEIKKDGSFVFDSIPRGYREKFLLIASDTLQGELEITTFEAKDTLELPPLEVQIQDTDSTEVKHLTSPDMHDMAVQYGFDFYLPDDARDEQPTIHRSLPLDSNVTVWSNDSTQAENVNYVEGIRGKAVRLEPGQFIDLDTLNPTTEDYTLSLWVLWDGPNEKHQILFSQRAYWSDSTSRLQWYFESNTGRFTVMKCMPQYPEAFFFGDSTSVPVGEWAFLVLVSKNHQVSMFVNGVQTGETGEFIPNQLDRSVPFRIGGNEIDEETWNGAIDEVNIENMARSPEWIRAKYESMYVEQRQTTEWP